MIKYRWLLGILVTILFSCKDEVLVGPDAIQCESDAIDLGTVSLDPESVSYVSYTGNEVIIFKNEVGDEVRFEPPQLQLNHLWLNTGFNLLCMSGDTNKYILLKELYSFSKECESLDLRMSLTIFPQNSRDIPLFNDELNLYLHGGLSNNFFDSTISLNITTSLRGNEDFSDALLIVGYKYGFASDTSLLNIPFQNVHYTIKPAGRILRSIFYTKEHGLVAFQDLNDRLWVFDRIE